MGLLSVGTPLSWDETKKYAAHVRSEGVKQFISLYRRLQDRTNDCLYFGDEVEYVLVKFDHANKKARLSLQAQPYLEKLQNDPANNDTNWTHEYASYMIEGTPGAPYGALSAHFNTVEQNMRRRRQQVLKVVGDSETVLSVTNFPRLGCPDFTAPLKAPNPVNGASKSLYFPDEAINQGHPRFATLTRNIRERRGEKVVIAVPIFQDVKTPQPFLEDFSQLGDTGESAKASSPDHVYMDCMGFGMGMCCLQMTFQACNVTEARHLYDQLTPLTGIVMAVSAATPIYKGHLCDIDHRWSIIASSVDDRTAEERGVEPLRESPFVINKSRYDSIDWYLSPKGQLYNDLDLLYDKKLYEDLLAGGIDKALAKHVAHLFIRDPVSLFAEKIEQDSSTDTDHFENIQSTNWQTMRFKPPPANSSIGWRVEFRPTECQLTDFENAAFTVFVVMMTRVILSYNLDLLIPISKVDENVRRAQKRDAIKTEKFFFRKDVVTSCSPPGASACVERHCGPEAVCSEMMLSQSPACSVGTSDGPSAEYMEMTVNEIINGKGSDFVGLIPLIYDYLSNIEVDVDTNCSIRQYLSFISKRASGELMTTAQWIRQFVTSHPDYKQDSVVSELINYDLLVACDQIGKGTLHCPELLPEMVTKTHDEIPVAMAKANNRGK